MKQRLSLAIISGLLVTVAAFLIGFSSRSLQRVSDVLLAPGCWIPEAYWGGVHDPLQLALAFVLNIVMYAIGVYVVLSLRGGKKL